MADNKLQISDELWEKMAPLLPEDKTQHPLGMCCKRVDNPSVMTLFSSCLEWGACGIL